MSKILIYQDNIKITEDEIRHEYYIVETYDQEPYQLFWFENAPDGLSRYQFRVWLQNVDFKPMIAFVLPDWSITIDNVEMEKKLYMELELEQEAKLN